MTKTRQTVQEAVNDYFSGKISVDEAFRRAYGGRGSRDVVVAGKATSGKVSSTGSQGKKR